MQFIATTNPLAAELEAYWLRKEYDEAENEAFHANVYRRLDDKFKEIVAPHDNQGRFGMSKGGGCTRAASLKLLGYKPAPMTGSQYFTFWLGHVIEVNVIASLEGIGFTVDGTQAAAAIDPMMHSYSDGLLSGRDFDHILSVKSAGYKMGGKRGTKFERRGFAALPVAGVKEEQRGWWAQMQLEMHATGKKKSLLVVAAKDMIKAFEKDDIMIENGSLTFYTEEVPYDRAFCENELVPVWRQQWAATQRGQAGLGMYLGKDGHFVPLVQASQPHFPNAGKTGTFNPCAYCDWVEPCKTAA